MHMICKLTENTISANGCTELCRIITFSEVLRGVDSESGVKITKHAKIKKVGFFGSFAGFLKFLRTDPRFYAKTPEELLKQASYIAKQMDAKLPSLFKTMPRLPYGVAPVPDHLAPKYTTGRYVGAALGSTQPGYYWVNTYALDRRPLYTLEALTFHEAVPGHHLQISLAQELDGLPEFRRYGGYTAYVEGWALYAESLGEELGLALTLEKIGRTSMTVRFDGYMDGEHRLCARSVLVVIEMVNGRPVPIADDLRRRLAAYQAATVPT